MGSCGSRSSGTDTARASGSRFWEPTVKRGRRHAQAVRSALQKESASVLILVLGGSSGLDDVSTWFDRHAAPARTLRELVRKHRYHAAGQQDRHPPTKLACVDLIRGADIAALDKLMLLLLVESLLAGQVRYTRVEDIARDCNSHRVTCQRALQRLAALGIISSGGVPRDKIEIRWDLLAAMIGTAATAAE